MKRELCVFTLSITFAPKCPRTPSHVLCRPRLEINRGTIPDMLESARPLSSLLVLASPRPQLSPSTHMHTQTHIHRHTHIYTHTHIYIHTHTHTHKHTRTHAHTHTHTHGHTYTIIFLTYFRTYSLPTATFRTISKPTPTSSKGRKPFIRPTIVLM